MLDKLKKLFKRNKYYKDGVITDEMREKGLEVRRQNAAIRTLQRQLDSQKKLEILEAAITGEKKGNKLEEALLQIIMQKFLNQPQQATQQEKQLNLYGKETAPQEQPKGLNDVQISNAVKIIKTKLPQEAQEFITRINDEDLIKIRHQLLE